MKFRILALTIFLASLAGPCFAQTFTVFGPKIYSKDKGAPVTYSDTFTVPPGTTDFQLIVTNGTEEMGGVKNVSILLNDVEVVSSADLRQSSTAVKDIVFLPSNTLEVTLKGQGGNAVSVRMIGRFAIPILPRPGFPAPN